MNYYQEREKLGQNPIDQSDQLDLWVDHAFTERWQAKVMDTFVVAQEPELLNSQRRGDPLPSASKEDNIVNTGTITLNTDWTRLFSTSLRLSKFVLRLPEQRVTHRGCYAQPVIILPPPIV